MVNFMVPSEKSPTGFVAGCVITLSLLVRSISAEWAFTVTERDGNGGLLSIVLPDAWTGCITFPWVAGSFSREQGFQNSELSKEMYFVSGTNCNGYTQNPVYDIAWVPQGPNSILGDGRGSQSVEFYTPEKRRTLRRRVYDADQDHNETSIEERQAGPVGVDVVNNGNQYLAPVDIGTGVWAIAGVLWGNDGGVPSLGAVPQLNEVSQAIGDAFQNQITSGFVDMGNFDIKYFIGPFVNGFGWADIRPSLARIISFRAMHYGADTGRSWTSFKITDYKGKVMCSIVIWVALLG